MLARQRKQLAGFNGLEHRDRGGAARRAALAVAGDVPAPQHGVFGACVAPTRTPGRATTSPGHRVWAAHTTRWPRRAACTSASSSGVRSGSTSTRPPDGETGAAGPVGWLRVVTSQLSVNHPQRYAAGSGPVLHRSAAAPTSHGRCPSPRPAKLGLALSMTPAQRPPDHGPRHTSTSRHWRMLAEAGATMGLTKPIGIPLRMCRIDLAARTSGAPCPCARRSSCQVPSARCGHTSYGRRPAPSQHDQHRASQLRSRRWERDLPGRIPRSIQAAGRY